MREVSHRHAVFGASLYQGKQGVYFLLGQARVKEGLQPIKRQFQRAQQQIGRLIESVIAAVSEIELLGIKAGYGVT